MTSIYFHIGGPKTGSSWLQSSFRLSRDVLFENEILYPLPENLAKLDEERISSGNGAALLRTGERPVRHRLNFSETGGKAVFYSSELLLEALWRTGVGRVISTISGGAANERLKVLLFIRNPVEHATSLWQQHVKRCGSTKSVSEAFLEFEIPIWVDKVLSELADFNDYDIVVRNYSVCKADILRETEDWLGLSPATLTVPGAGRVNRSMTRGELSLLQALNREIAAGGHLLADRLCERLPEIPADRILPPRSVQEAMCERLRPAIARVNARLPEEHRYQYDIRDPEGLGPEVVFGEEQLALIGECLGGEIARLRQRDLRSMRTTEMFREVGRELAWRVRRRVQRARPVKMVWRP